MHEEKKFAIVLAILAGLFGVISGFSEAYFTKALDLFPDHFSSYGFLLLVLVIVLIVLAYLFIQRPKFAAAWV